MANIKVLLTDQSNVVHDVSYITDIPLSLNFLIADIRTPDKRNATFSKTINFPGTKDIDAFFSYIFNVNDDLSSLDPRLKVGIKYYINERLQLDGNLQLIKVNVDPITNLRNYETSSTGKLGNLFVAIGDKYLIGNETIADDLDFSAYDHTLNYTNINATWTATPGTGYYYGLINRGFNQVNSDYEFLVKDFRPSLYDREILYKIFTDAGYTWTSTFLDSAFFKRTMTDCIGESFPMASADITNSQFFVSRSSTQTGSSFATTYGIGIFNQTSTNLTDTVLFNDETTSPYNDPGGVYTPATGIFTVPTTRAYDLVTNIVTKLTYSNTFNTVTDIDVISGLYTINIEGYDVATASWVVVATNSQPIPTGLNGSDTITANFNCVHSGVLTAGVTYRVCCQPAALSVNLYKAGPLLITTGVSSILQKFYGTPYLGTPTTLQVSNFYVLLKDYQIVEGDTVQVTQALPTKMKQSTFLTNLIKKYNLYFEQDPDNEFNYIIEPRDSGFYTGTDDWSDELDFSKPYEVLPISEMDCKRYEYTFKTDADEYNKLYFDYYKEPYGFGYTDNTSDFVKGVKRTELDYASTPLVSTNTGLIIPKTYRNDSGVFKNFTTLPRALYNGGLKPVQGWGFKIVGSTGGTAPWGQGTQLYPFLGDCDDPINPTFFLNWSTPHRVYYKYPQATFTDNNLKNVYYSKMIAQLTDKRSTVIRAWFNLDETKINKFSFRKIVFVQYFNAWFYVESINNYNINDRESTQVTLLKLPEVAAWSGSIILPPDPIVTEGGKLLNGNYTSGYNNQNYASASQIVSGSNNYIAQGAENVLLYNCTDVIVNSDVTSFTGIGLVGPMIITSSSSNTTLNGADTILNTTTSLTLNTSYNNRILEVDATSNDITLTWDVNTMQGIRIYINRVDNSNYKVYINDVASDAYFMGEVMPYDMGLTQWESIPLTSNIDTFGNKQIKIFA